ncbi:META domain-containing protein [Campylobacter sp. VicNov18]|uniref:META domain-containing protein n=1 Tax=Campylobacter bilis TaxID=2691918 RepID=UPI00130D8309|nr:META domain-containing protein [Campylobacter bilis]MPV63873.1 META domain-containing protein [Campylobacter hepaticus]MBM0637374.1 META domain-containing protein [Campylobacter bilis]MCC8278095.1 META domain-containing protein [Campylobacter bilis]MCC8299599.1 META domain-containing protein [Campylobacter bilis]MCC8301004.1 META domain-containing protein [Campylobacter bilis]
MKKMFQIALSAVFLAACSNSSTSLILNSKSDKELTQNHLFKIEKIIVNGKTYDPKNAEESPNITFENNKFYGYAGCNRFFGSYQNSGDILQIEGDRVASTQMLCHPLDVMDFENSFLSNFKGTFQISDENGKLVLSNDEMKIFFQ